MQVDKASDTLKLLNGLGFAMKAGKVRSGELAAEKTLKSGKAKLVLLDSGASAATLSRWSSACEHASVPLITVEGVGRAIGREAHMVACVTDNGFAQMLMRTYKILDPNFGGNLNGKE